MALATWRSTSSATRAPLRVADVAEAIDVEHGHRQRRALARGAGDLQLQHALEGDAVGETGEAVGVREAVGVIGLLPDRVAQPRLADGHGGQVGDGEDGIGHLVDRRLRVCPAQRPAGPR